MWISHDVGGSSVLGCGNGIANHYSKKYQGKIDNTVKEFNICFIDE